MRDSLYKRLQELRDEIAQIEKQIGWHLYTDGSANNQRRIGGFAWALVYGDQCREADSGLLDPTTSNMAELTAIWEGIRQLPPGISSLTVYSDSMIAINWVAYQSRCNLQAARKMRNDINQVIRDRQIDVQFIHVSGHTGIKWNELVDKLALESWKDPVVF